MASFHPKQLRRCILKMAFHGEAVHIACAFSLVEVLGVLYSTIIRYDPLEPESPDRDYLILSKGHGVMALYACFHEIGWLTDRDLENYFQPGTLLRGLCEADVPGCEATTGSLGHGLPIATGVALGLKRLGSRQRVYCIVGDGEMNEGSMWEAMLFAAHQQLDNLTVIVDANGLQAMGRTEDVLNLEPLAGKCEAFGFDTRTCDGHDADALRAALADLQRTVGRPTALLARTIKGYGVSFMANDNRWHYTRLTADAYERAMAELA